MTKNPVIPEAAVEAAARGMAILDDHDGCFLEVDAWNAQEEWEREAHPDNYPGSSIEDCAYWIAKARAALEAAAPLMLAEAWGVAAILSESLILGDNPEGDLEWAREHYRNTQCGTVDNTGEEL